METFLSYFGKDITFFGAICSLLGILGTALGIINSWIAISNEKIKVKVSLGFSLIVEDILMTCTNPFKNLNQDLLDAANEGIFIFPNFKIINKSKYDLYIEDYGFTDSFSKKNIACFIKDMHDMPKEIKSFSSINILCKHYSIFDVGNNWKYAYITLSTGKTFFFKMRNFKKVIIRLQNRKPATNINP
ncbi:MAG: hypothetical protein K6C97_00670 [Treponema sp.]|nr:hypothetical protein [Treponema sp.]